MKKDFWAGLKGFSVIAAIVILIWIANFFAMPYFFPADEGGKIGNAGTAGDMFGGITALFSGLAFAGLITTLVMQRKELELQRNELSQTREVFSVQRFENTFFGLLNLLNQHVQSIETSERQLKEPDGIGYSTSIRKGRDALVIYAEYLPRFKTNMEGNTFAKVIAEYEHMFDKQFDAVLGPYFRLIYNILRHIENAELSSKKNDSDRATENERLRLVYSKILRAHLNSAEIKLLMFNCASVHGSELKGWVEKHSMLKHITREEYRSNKLIVDEYNSLAFQFDERATNS